MTKTELFGGDPNDPSYMTPRRLWWVQPCEGERILCAADGPDPIAKGDTVTLHSPMGETYVLDHEHWIACLKDGTLTSMQVQTWPERAHILALVEGYLKPSSCAYEVYRMRTKRKQQEQRQPADTVSSYANRRRAEVAA